MGASDFNTCAKIEGTKEEIFNILKAMYSYATDKREQYREKRNCPYLMSLDIHGDGETGFGANKRMSDFSDDELLAYIEEKNCVICVEASGPYGVFNTLEGVRLFHEMAEAASNAYFNGGMGGFSTGGDEFANFELKDGLLYCKYASREDEWDDEDFDEDEDGWDDEEDDWEDEEPEWDYEVIYDPVKKKYVK